MNDDKYLYNNGFEEVITNFYFIKKRINKHYKKRFYKTKNYIFLKLLYLFIFIFLIKINNINIFYKNQQIYYSYIKYKIYNRIKAKKIFKNIKFGIYIFSLSNGGRERITSLLINYLYREKIFDIYLFTNTYKNPYEYKIPDDISRVKVSGIEDLKNKLIQKNIDILVYQDYYIRDMEILNNLKKVKIIYYIHSTFIFWIYCNKRVLKRLYNQYKNSKYLISLIPFENDFLFKKWNINSILMNNFITYNFEDVIPSNLSSKTIIMIGRADDHMKRFDLGIKAMKYIVKEIHDCEMKIISNLYGVDYLMNLVEELDLNKNIKFVGFTLKPEIYYKNASLHIFSSIIECFPMVLSETKIYGIPNIIVGIDYVSTAKGGVININDDNPENIAKEAIKILKNDNYRKKLGKDARESMKKFQNILTSKKWVELLLSVYNGEYFYNKLKNEEKRISEKEAINILDNQIKLLNMRMPTMKNITINDIFNMNF